VFETSASTDSAIWAYFIYVNVQDILHLAKQVFVYLLYQDNLVEMETILLQINNNKAYKLIEDLEALNIVKVLKKSAEPKEKLSKKFAGSLNLSDEEYNNFQDSITQSRSEWERDI
jgi:hypothetical protein